VTTAESKYWNQQQRARLDYLVKNAQYVHVVNDTTKVAAKGYHTRNTALVDHGNVVLSRWDGRGHGGTYNCINQTNSKDVPVFDATIILDKKIIIWYSKLEKYERDYRRKHCRFCSFLQLVHYYPLILRKKRLNCWSET